MVNFNELPYKRLDYLEVKEKVNNLTDKLKYADNLKNFLEIFKELNLIQTTIEEYNDYVDIQNMRDCKNEFYLKELEYWTEYKPKYDILFQDMYEIMNNTKYKNELLDIIPENFFNTISYELKTKSKLNIDLEQQENKLKQKYKEILNNKCVYEGVEYNISKLKPLLSNSDRKIRKKAHDAYNDFFENHSEELDKLFIELIKIRNQMAKNLGFENYKEFSVYDLRRFGYDYNDIHLFRENIKKYIIPITNELKVKQLKELGIKELKYYDTIFFKEDPKLLNSGQDLLDSMRKSFRNIDNDLGNFYEEMLDNDYIDLLNRDNKIHFAITNYLTLTNQPTITGNFKNEWIDLEILTHEFGHSYQKHIASINDKNYIISPLLKYPTFDTAEMFSHAMELISLRSIKDNFNEKDYKKYEFMIIRNLLNYMPYIALVDEFQEEVYSKPNITIEEVRKTWKRLSDDYDLTHSNTGHTNLDKGGYFYRQSHIFLNPFYYIDYAISYFGALAIWQNSNKNLDTFKDMAKVASYYPLNTLVKKFDIANPFDEESVKSLSLFLKNKINN